MRFVAGFLVASLLWGGFIYAYSQGLLNINLEPERAEEIVDAGPEEEVEPDPKQKRKKKWRKKKRKKRYSGESMTGDDLGDPDARHMDPTTGGGEEQLLGHEIEQGFDSVMPKLRRCLILAADDEPVTGRLVFGLRVAGSGRVSKVNLKGPSAITKTEAGSCLRGAAKGIRFRSFNGPDMLVQFPMTLE
ncbi:MAG: hypothetical protein OXT09_16190 [Myxococcales bacterium]|nr:hypothetical protein [Myxococcales bacterium]